MIASKKNRPTKFPAGRSGENSGELIAQLIINQPGKEEDGALSIVTDYLNKNMERLVGTVSTFTQEPALPVTAAPASPPTFDAAKFLYISPNVTFTGKDQFVKQLEDTLNKRKDLYVFINYSQDVSTVAYLQRAKGSRPKNIPDSVNYKVYTLVNIPGSVEEQIICESCNSTANVTVTEAIESDISNFQSVSNSKYVLSVLHSIRNSYRLGKNLELDEPPNGKLSFDAEVTLETGKSYYVTLIFQKSIAVNESMASIELDYITQTGEPLKGISIYSTEFQNSNSRLLSLAFKNKDENAVSSYINELNDYLFTKPQNILLFVNGYRNKLDTDEFPDSDNSVILNVDPRNYWDGIDISFANRIGNKSLLVYVDGHHKITTSNHNKNDNIRDSKQYFLSSLFGSQCASGQSAQYGSTIGKCADLCFHETKCVTLHTTPNIAGFNARQANGKIAGQHMVDMLKNGTLPLGNGKDKTSGVIDIVAHSMGYAYALGMIGEIKKAGYKLGRFYIIAPENACSGLINLNDFEEVWQYGSNEKEDPVWEQDGIAPQCGVAGLPPNPVPGSTQGRIYIPKNDPKRDFIGAHSISSYGWIFDKITSILPGYVKKR